MDAASWKKDEDDIMFRRLFCLKICSDIKLLFCSTTLTVCKETELKSNNALLYVYRRYLGNFVPLPGDNFLHCVTQVSLGQRKKEIETERTTR